MPLSRVELEHLLDALDASVPQLAQDMQEPADFWTRFGSAADAIQRQAGPDERTWVRDRLDAIQVKHHPVPPADAI